MLVAKRIALLFLAFNLANAAPEVALAQENLQKKNFSIKALPINEALHEFSKQSGVQVMFLSESDEQFYSQEITGSYTFYEAMQQMLAGTILKVQYVNEKIIRIDGPKEKRPGQKDEPRGRKIYLSEPPDKIGYITDGAPMRVASVSEGEEGRSSGPASSEGSSGVSSSTPEILVLGSKLLNMDIRRTEDDTQPYVVFRREDIERSAVSNVEEFLRKNLTSSTGPGSNVQSGNFGNISNINLRGLGPAQTLVLVDGRRMPAVGVAGGVAQANINGIPISAIERIEVLPATASGIYGGGATGGVVNIVMRREYSGLEVGYQYEGALSGGGGAKRRYDLHAGHSMLGGKVFFSMAASHSVDDPLYVKDRPFQRRVIDGADLSYFFGLPFPPLGALTNIMSTDGRDLALSERYGGRSLGSRYTHVPSGYSGVESDAGQGLVENAASYDLGMAPTSQTTGGGQSLLGGLKAKSISSSVKYDVSDRISLFVDFLSSRSDSDFYNSSINGVFDIPAGSDGNPFSNSVRISTPIVSNGKMTGSSGEDRVAAGFILRPFDGWSLSIDYSRGRGFWSRSAVPVALSPVAAGLVRSGEVDVFRDAGDRLIDFSDYELRSGILPSRSEISALTLKLSGELAVGLPGGRPVLTSSVEVNEDKLGSYFSTDGFGNGTKHLPRSQSVTGAYLELGIPLVSPANKIFGVYALEARAAGRWDDYRLDASNSVSVASSVEAEGARKARLSFNSFNPTFSMKYSPVRGISLRASYGTGFLPPSLNQLVPNEVLVFNGSRLGLRDPKRGNEVLGEVRLRGGGNPDLRPEDSRSTSAGIVFDSLFVDGLRFSVDWVEIRKRDNIWSFGVSQLNLNDEDLIPGLVERGSPSDGYDFGVITDYRASFVNVARQDVSSVDLSLSYSLSAGRWGDFVLWTGATKNLENEIQIISSLPVRDQMAGSLVLEWSASGSVEWVYNNFSMSWSSRYYDSYCISAGCLPLPIGIEGRLSSQMYQDINISYDFPDYKSSYISGLRVNFGVRNLTNEVPGLVSTPPYYSTYGNPMLRSYFASLLMRF